LLDQSSQWLASAQIGSGQKTIAKSAFLACLVVVVWPSGLVFAVK